MSLNMGWGILLPYTHLGSCGRNLQSSGCVLGGKSQVELLSLNARLFRVGQHLARLRGVVPKKITKAE
jgi:hypothetical protein